MDGRDKPGHDEKASHFQAVRKSLKMLDAFSVRLFGKFTGNEIPPPLFDSAEHGHCGFQASTDVPICQRECPNQESAAEGPYG